MIKDKILYSDIFYNIPTKGDVEVKEGDKLSFGDEIKESNIDSTDLTYISYEGTILVKEGDEVVADETPLYETGKFKKKKVLSKVSGKVDSFDDKQIFIDSYDKSIKKITDARRVEFSGKVIKKTKKNLVVQTKGLILNLLASKGTSVVGNLFYLADPHAFVENPDKELLKDKIVVCETIDSTLYPVLSALGAKGVFALTADHKHFSDIVMLNAAVGLIFGFGELKLTKNIKDIFKNNNEKLVWFDSEYQRLVIVTDEAPEWLKTYKFDIKSLISYK